jgi:hypothetical protein
VWLIDNPAGSWRSSLVCTSYSIADRYRDKLDDA